MLNMGEKEDLNAPRILSVLMRGDHLLSRTMPISLSAQQYEHLQSTSCSVRTSSVSCLQEAVVDQWSMMQQAPENPKRHTKTITNLLWPIQWLRNKIVLVPRTLPTNDVMTFPFLTGLPAPRSVFIPDCNFYSHQKNQRCFMFLSGARRILDKLWRCIFRTTIYDKKSQRM